MRSLLDDLRYALRSLRRSPGFAAAAVATLALGIGANTSIFSVVDAVLLEPLPFPEPDRVIRVHTAFPRSGLTGLSLSPGEMTDIQEGTEALSEVGAFIPATFTLSTGDGEPERVSGAWTTPGFFRALGVPAAVGRVFVPREREPGAPRAAVLAHGFWRRRFGGEPGIVGREIALDERPFTVVGVMPPEFDYPENVDVWTNLRFEPGLLAPGERGSRYLRTVARLAPAVDLEGAERALAALATRFAVAHPDFYADTDFRLSVEPLRRGIVGDARPPLLLVMAAVGLLLLLACANLANLALVRADGRRREVAVRAALGASRGRLARGLLCEGILVSAAAGVLGLAAAAGGVGLLLRMAPADLPRLGAVGVDGWGAAFALGVAVLTGLGFGLLPARHAAAVSPADALRGGSRGTRGRPEARLRDGLVVGQAALCVALLVGGGLVARSLLRLRAVETGMDPARVLTARIGLPESRYGETRDVEAFYRGILEELGAAPGVRSAAAAAILPLAGGGWNVSFELPGGSAPRQAPDLTTEYRPVTPGFFGTLGIRRVRGRGFTEADAPDAPLVAIVNEAFVRRYLAGDGVDGPIGRRVELPILGVPVDSHVREIVGVVADVRSSLAEEAPPKLYVPHAQQPRREMTLLLRVAGGRIRAVAGGEAPPTEAGDPRALLGTLRAAVRAADPGLPVYEIRTMGEVVGTALARHRFTATLLGAFSLAALALAALGIYAVVGYAVSRRTREIGIRRALGETPGRAVARAAGRGTALVALGAGVGAGVALAGSRLVEGLLFGVSPADPVSYSLAAAFLLGVGALASWIPARRAARVDPLVALRQD